MMMRVLLAGLAAAAITAAATPAAVAQTPPPYATTKVEGTDNVYIFRYGNHQSMFVVTNDGVIATDPIALARPQAATTYIDEIKKVTDKPIKLVIYSHHHFDHITGGKPFKALGATFWAHENVKKRLALLNDPDTVMPDLTVGNKGGIISLGGTQIELLYLGRNHSDSSLVMRLPKNKIIFAVDFLPVASFPGVGDDRLVPDRVGRFGQEGAGDGLGAAHSRSSRAGRTPRHQGRRAQFPRAAAGRVVDGANRRARRQVLAAGRQRGDVPEIRQLAGL